MPLYFLRFQIYPSSFWFWYFVPRILYLVQIGSSHLNNIKLLHNWPCAFEYFKMFSEVSVLFILSKSTLPTRFWPNGTTLYIQKVSKADPSCSTIMGFTNKTLAAQSIYSHSDRTFTFASTSCKFFPKKVNLIIVW